MRVYAWVHDVICCVWGWLGGGEGRGKGRSSGGHGVRKEAVCTATPFPGSPTRAPPPCPPPPPPPPSFRSVFFISHDDQFMIKTMHKEEIKLLLRWAVGAALRWLVRCLFSITLVIGLHWVGRCRRQAQHCSPSALHSPSCHCQLPVAAATWCRLPLASLPLYLPTGNPAPLPSFDSTHSSPPSTPPCAACCPGTSSMWKPTPAPSSPASTACTA
jgi:hypothetical protein